ncbi:MAG: ACT domain-containing protein, partial [Ruminococcaceae bacterium]|nr:ACT domain-containing protein [Oscillospiraceae bacterium]
GSIGGQGLKIYEDVAKVSVVGSGMQSNYGVASRVFGALAGKRINIRMISTSEIKISVLIDKVDADKAVSAIHDEFFR